MVCIWNHLIDCQKSSWICGLRVRLIYIWPSLGAPYEYLGVYLDERLYLLEKKIDFDTTEDKISEIELLELLELRSDSSVG